MIPEYFTTEVEILKPVYQDINKQILHSWRPVYSPNELIGSFTVSYNNKKEVDSVLNFLDQFTIEEDGYAYAEFGRVQMRILHQTGLRWNECVITKCPETNKLIQTGAYLATHKHHFMYFITNKENNEE